MPIDDGISMSFLIEPFFSFVLVFLILFYFIIIFFFICDGDLIEIMHYYLLGNRVNEMSLVVVKYGQ